MRRPAGSSYLTRKRWTSGGPPLRGPPLKTPSVIACSPPLVIWIARIVKVSRAGATPRHR